MNLTDLLKDSGTISQCEVQQNARERFWEIIGHSTVARWRKGDKIPQSGRTILIGLAPAYSNPDLELAQQIINMVKDNRATTEVRFFDVLDVVDMQDMQNYIPGIGDVYQTPVVGIWQNGTVVSTAQGLSAKQLALEALSGG